MPEQPFDPEDPPRIGQYEVLSRLGRGGMATVYLGRGISGRKVAIKLIRRDLAADEGFLRRFEHEAASTRKVRQAYIAPVLDYGYHRGRPFLVTEYIEGPTVDEAVREHGPMAAHEVEQLGEQVAAALVAIHKVGLVHRDLKPSNVILGRTGPRVIDFGIARALDDSGGLTSQNMRLGTPSFMAPEQFDPDAEVDQPADVFAWGGLMVFASTGQPPFGRAANQPVALLAHWVTTNEPNLDALDEPLRTLVREAMAKDPARRPKARDLVHRLSTGDHPTPAPAAATTENPAPTDSEPAATAPIGTSAFTAPRPPDPPPTARYRTISDWQQGGVPADSPGAVLPTWTAHLVRAGIAIVVILLVLVGWVLLPEAARLVVGVGVGGPVVLGVIAWGISRSASHRPKWLLWPVGGFILLAVFWWFTYHRLHYQTWVGFDRDDRVAVLEGAGPDGLMGVPNVTGTEPFPTHRSELPSLLAAAVDDGIGVGDHNEGTQIARCLPWIFTPTVDTPSSLAEACSTSAFATTPRFPVPDHHTEDTTKHPPAAAATDDQLLLASTSYDGSLQVSSSNDGLEFTSSKPVGDGFESDFEPALATDGTQFFLAWRDRNGYLALASSNDGRDFGEPLVLNTTTRTAPALAYGDGMLLLAWVDDGGKLHLWPAADAASLEFLVEQRIDLDERSPGAPNLQYARKTWTLTWAGTDHKVNIQTYRGSIEAIPTKHTLAHRGAPITEHRPAIAVLDVWLLAWTRPDGRVGLLVSKSRQPGYINELALDVSSGAGVNLTPFQGDVLLTWAGDDEQPGGHLLRLP